MDKTFHNNIDLLHNQLVKSRLENVSSLPVGLGLQQKGRIVYYNSELYLWNGTTWFPLSTNILVKKSGDQVYNAALNGAGTYINDNHLYFSVLPNSRYHVNIVYKMSINTTSITYLKLYNLINNNAISGISFIGEYSLNWQASLQSDTMDFYNGATLIDVSQWDNTDWMFKFSGILDTTGAEEAFTLYSKLKFECNFPGAELTLKEGSYITATRVV